MCCGAADESAGFEIHIICWDRRTAALEQEIEACAQKGYRFLTPLAAIIAVRSGLRTGEHGGGWPPRADSPSGER